MNDQKNNSKQLLCLNEKQTTWCVSFTIILLCIVMIISYIAGYRSAIRNVVDTVKKDSFSDQLYTSVTALTLKDHQTSKEGYFIQCKAQDKDIAQNIIQLSKKEGFLMSIIDTRDSHDDKESYHLVSPVVYAQEEIKTIETFLKNKANIHQYDIITVEKTQKLKGYLS
jgi:hypothetical protein